MKRFVLLQVLAFSFLLFFNAFAEGRSPLRPPEYLKTKPVGASSKRALHSPFDTGLTKLGEWGTGYYQDVMVNGNYAYCAAGDAGLDIIDISDPANPTKVGTFDTGDDVRGIHIAGTKGAIANSFGGVILIDLTDPVSPTRLDSYNPGIMAEGVFIRDNYIYVAATSFGLHIMAITGNELSTAGECSTAYYARNVYVDGNYAYVADDYGGLQVVDVSNPWTCSVVGAHATNGSANDIYVSGNYAYVANWGGLALEILDISNPLQPSLVGSYGGSGYGLGLQLSGSNIYLADTVGLRIVDVSNPATPLYVGMVDTAGGTRAVSFINTGAVCLAADWGGLQVVNATNPASPSVTGSYDQSNWFVGMHVEGNYAYLADNFSGLKVVDISNSSAPTLAGEFAQDSMYEHLRVNGNYAYIDETFFGLYIIDISNPTNPVLANSYPVNEQIGAFDVSGNYAYLTDGTQRLQVLDMSDPLNPSQLGTCAIPGGNSGLPRDVILNGNHVYISDGSGGVKIFDVSTPTNPTWVSSYTASGNIQGTYIMPSGRYAYLADSSGDMRILDISIPANPNRVGIYPLNDVEDIVFQDDHAYVADYTAGLVLLDVSEPTAPTQTGSYSLSRLASEVELAGSRIVVASRASGKVIVFNNPNIAIPELSLNRTSMVFGADTAGNVTPSQDVAIGNSGAGVLDWTVSADQSWVSFSPANGNTNSGLVTVSVDTTGLAAGSYTATLTVNDLVDNTVNSTETVAVTLNVYTSGSTEAPIGVFSTPINGSTVSSSVPFTGWVLDDLGVVGVGLYREDGDALAYIGDALLVEGARPDVETAYPGFPHNYTSGWGYMMLTNFLPTGDGTYVIHARATDIEGNVSQLGTTTITVNNSEAVKPFGAIDTPSQGGMASGSITNSGWILTPLPNIIPTDGSTINIYVDGVNLGNPLYNLYREDIAALFPGYANSEGAQVDFDFDTTGCENGVHTIAWSAEDNAGNADGIGSRYFSIWNEEGSGNVAGHFSLKGAAPPSPFIPGPGNTNGNSFALDRLMEAAKTNRETIDFKKGWSVDTAYRTAECDDNGVININIRELERLVLKIPGKNGIKGFTVVGPYLKRLPLGSFLDSEKGIFYWQPGVGFVGEYSLMFVEKAGKDIRNVRVIRVTILPRE
ncbi:MAG: hypothetical protein GY757_45935 [bacterium]|nr:hypothetical protein [bacterium]